MSTVQDHLNDENGSVAMNKAAKLRRLPFSPLSRRQGNVIVVSKVSANSALKPNKPIISSKIKKNSTKSLSENDGVLENNAEWSKLLLKGSAHEKAPKILSAEESSSSFREEVCSDMRPKIFRQMLDYDDRDDTMVLKRASPIYDSDDDEDFQSSPTKRQRTLGGATALQWGERLQETSDGFSLLGLILE